MSDFHGRDYLSSPEAITSLQHRISQSNGILVVTDGDGTSLIGFNVMDVTDPVHPVLTPFRVPADIEPFSCAREGRTFTVDDPAYAGRTFCLQESIFVGEPMNVYFHPEMAKVINAINASGRPSPLIINTGRSREQLLEILSQSGVREPGKTDAITDHGERLTLDGETTMIKPFASEEIIFLSRVKTALGNLPKEINNILRRHHMNTENMPPVILEEKTFAMTVNVRQLLEHLGLKEKEGVGKEVMEHIEEAAKKIVDSSINPVTEGKKSFVYAHEPFSIDIRRGDIDKGLGMSMLLDKLRDKGRLPPAVLFSGDSLLKLGNPGTDYSAMSFLLQTMPEKYHLEWIGVQILHPADLHAETLTPDPDKIFPAEHPLAPGQPGGIGVVLSTPQEYSRVLAEALTQRLVNEQTRWQLRIGERQDIART